MGTLRVVKPLPMRTVTRSRSRFSRPTCNYNENAPGARTFSSREELARVPSRSRAPRFILVSRHKERERKIASLKKSISRLHDIEKTPTDSVPIKGGRKFRGFTRKRIVPFLPSFRSRRDRALEFRSLGRLKRSNHASNGSFFPSCIYIFIQVLRNAS